MKCYVFLNVELNNGANRTIEINQMKGGSKEKRRGKFKLSTIPDKKIYFR